MWPRRCGESQTLGQKPGQLKPYPPKHARWAPCSTMRRAPCRPSRICAQGGSGSKSRPKSLSRTALDTPMKNLRQNQKTLKIASLVNFLAKVAVCYRQAVLKTESNRSAHEQAHVAPRDGQPWTICISHESKSTRRMSMVCPLC